MPGFNLSTTATSREVLGELLKLSVPQFLYLAAVRPDVIRTTREKLRAESGT